MAINKNANTTVVESATGQPEPVAVPGSKENGTEASATLHPHSKAEFGKTELLAQAVAVMGGMSTEAINKFVESLTMNAGPNQSGATEGDAAKNAASIKTHPSAAMKEDVAAMFEGQGLSEETLDKAVTIFEAAVHLRAELENQRLNEEYQVKLDEAIKEVTEEVTTRIDEYLTYVVEQWMEENQVAIDSQIQTDITTNFMSKLKDLFTDSFIEVPQDKIDVVEELTDENAELEEKLNAAMQEVIELKAKINNTEKPAIVEEASAGLSELQKAKFKDVVKSIDINLNEEEYKAKVTVLREHYFKSTASTGVVLNESEAKTKEEIDAETKKTGGNAAIVEETDPLKRATLDVLSRSVR